MNHIPVLVDAGLAFIAVDTVISNGPIRNWMQYHFRRLAAPHVKLAEVDKAVPHISTRIVSSIHILIQVLLCSGWLSCCIYNLDICRELSGREHLL